MTVTQGSRHQLFKKLEKVLGMDEAGTLMDLVPPMGWADLATKHDIDHLRLATKHDIDQLRVATKADIDQLRVSNRLDLEVLKNDLASKFRGLFFALAALFIGVVGLLLAVLRLS